MDLLIEQPGNDSDELRDLYQWLANEPALDAVREVREEVAADTLGANLTGLIIQLSPEAGTVLTTVLVAWLRNKRGEIKISAESNQDGSSKSSIKVKYDGSNDTLTSAINQFVARCTAVGEQEPVSGSLSSAGAGDRPSIPAEGSNASRRRPKGRFLRRGH
jgi:hypothetical protein